MKIVLLSIIDDSPVYQTGLVLITSTRLDGLIVYVPPTKSVGTISIDASLLNLIGEPSDIRAQAAITFVLSAATHCDRSGLVFHKCGAVCGNLVCH